MIDSQIKSSAKCVIQSLKLLVRGKVTDTLPRKKNTGSWLALGWFPELGSKILLVKTLHSLVKGYGEIKVVLSSECSSCQLSFIVPEGAMQAVRGWKSLTVATSYEPGSFTRPVLVRYSFVYNSSMNLVVLVKHFLIGLKSPFHQQNLMPNTGWSRTMDGELIVVRSESSIIIFINVHSFTLSSECICLCP